MKTAALVLAIALGLGAGALAGQLPGSAAGVQESLKLPYPQADTLKNPIAANPASLTKGKSLFSKNCASCHGTKGNGDTPLGKAFNPPARDFTDTTWQGRYTDGQIFAVIAKGIPGTGMVPFEKSIKEGDRWNLVNYIRTLSLPKKGE
jgi:mono/diheme cytochrome c family protein